MGLELVTKTAILTAMFFATTVHAEEKSTQDFDFLIGTWAVEAKTRLNLDSPSTAIGERTCAFYLNKDYVKCEMQRTYGSGSQGVSASFHNYNHLYGYYESLYLSSGWPIKPLGATEFTKEDDTIHWVNEFEFQTGGGRTENVRSETTVSDGVMVTKEFIKFSTTEKEGDYELAYQEIATRK